ncbi:hypothetical protein NDU88_000302 [Pleurodeles waltl]|uniref:Uncharacterized protein n=1 Tax=Pleurodeles waltl TaxID=8319 RepID=A0AAV7UPL8_PLEWA|nr:hypothetical protein NDU88_000302 [Pleurodeles waltl]
MDSAATSDPEVQRTSTNPRPHPGHKEQSEDFRAMLWLHNGDGSVEKGTDEWQRRSWGIMEEDGEDQEEGAVIRPKTQQETLQTACILEPAAREAPSENSGHAWGKAWPLQVHTSHREEGGRSDERDYKVA